MRRLRGFVAQIVLLIILPLFVVLTGAAIWSVQVHNRDMRNMMAHNDQETVRAMALAISEYRATYGPASDTDIGPLINQLNVEHDQAFVILVDAASRTVYRSDEAQVGSTEYASIAHALAGQSGAAFTPQGYVVTYAPVKIEGTNWALVMEDPWAGGSSSWLNTSLLAPLILVPVVALSLLAIWLGVRRIIVPLQKLDTQVTALGWGDFDAIDKPVGGTREIEELQKALGRMAAQVRAAQQGMRGYIGAVTQAQEDERKRLARELHDDTVQSLVALKQQSHRIRRLVTRDPGEPGQTEAALAELQDMITKTMNDVRRFSHALRPVYLEEAGLAAALEMLAREAKTPEGVQVRFETIGDTRRLPAEIELALYRIAQEALTNAIKHAQARQILVQMDFNDGVLLRVKDDGAGFVQPERVSDLVAAGHYGLMGIQERAQLIGAKLSIRSQPETGTGIEVRLAPPR